MIYAARDFDGSLAFFSAVPSLLNGRWQSGRGEIEWTGLFGEDPLPELKPGDTPIMVEIVVANGGVRCQRFG